MRHRARRRRAVRARRRARRRRGVRDARDARAQQRARRARRDRARHCEDEVPRGDSSSVVIHPRVAATPAQRARGVDSIDFASRGVANSR
jgi:hypothetical protein